MLGRIRISRLVSSTLNGLSTLGGYRKASRFVSEDQGNIGIIFAAMIVPTVAILGMSVDLGRAVNQKHLVQASLDAAVLAAGRNMQVNGDVQLAVAMAETSFEASMSGQGDPELDVSVDTDTNIVTLTANQAVPTTFLSLLGIDKLDVAAATEATLAAGGTDKNLEISLMLDVTGSMCQPCSKLADLKVAAKDLVNILVQDDQDEFTSRVALAPFSHAVNVGSANFEAVTGEKQVVEDVFSYPPSCYRNGRLKGSCAGNPQYLTVVGHNYSSCVVERRGSHKFTDEFPTDLNGHANNNDDYLGIFDVERGDASGGYVDEDTVCKPESRIVSLTSDKDGIIDAIDQLEAEGSTAGQIGTAWAWYLLSPKWNSLWPTDSRAAEYGDVQTMKIAILMTDGDYNTAFQTGNGSSSSQAKQICREMKKAGVTVYTVGFMVGSSAKKLLKDCATSDTHFYDAANGDDLKMAFRSIAFKVSQIRLSK